jgi:FkbM family methyltransferase
MFTRFLHILRQRFHPLHHLRRNRFMASRLLPLLDRPVARRLRDVRWPVWTRRIGHATYGIDSRIVEPGELALFAVLCRAYELRVLWDVGANMGLYSWLFLSRDPCAAATMFEPDPDNLALIDRTVETNGLDRVTVVRCAVSDRLGETDFATDPLTGHTGHLADVAVGDAPTIKVPVVTLDHVAADRPPPDIVKIDVEGAEGRVFAGALSLLEKHQPIILFESFGGLTEITSLLTGLGYRIFNGEDPDGSLEAAANFLALPGDKAGDVEARRTEWRAELRARGF